LDEQRKTLLEGINSLLLARHSYQVSLAEIDRKPIPLLPKLNPVDTFQNDAFSPMSSLGAIELKASEFDDGGPSALTSAQPIQEPLSPKSAPRPSRFSPKKTDSQHTSPTIATTFPLKSEAAQSSAQFQGRRESVRNLFDTLGFHRREVSTGREASTTCDTPMPISPNATGGAFSFLSFGKKHTPTYTSKASTDSNSAGELPGGFRISEASRPSVAKVAADKISNEKFNYDKGSSIRKPSSDKVSIGVASSEAALSNQSISASIKSSEAKQSEAAL
jgi:hypothetical protein